MSSPDIEVQCLSQCVANGIYDHVADAITNLGKDGLGEANFGVDWTTTVQDNYSGTNWSYVNTKDGRTFKTNIIGQIATSACDTKHSAKGTHFTKKNVSLSDSDTVKWKWALSKPTLCSPNLADIWENQLTSIEDWITEEEKRTGTQGSKINPCITKSSNDLQYVDLIMLTSQHIYETFQLGVQAIKVLHPSDEPVEEKFIPILSMTSIELSKDDLAIAGFSTFDLGVETHASHCMIWQYSLGST
ncbi:uncharacterized protein HD556DRAFT_1439779 [Suillus plorans]|uniref:Uncharacterized protein n=1 Tax=Suillus plorans TaxID=116603 RepID=A0A9P7DNV8_9AGAM|nr:uncharacterized protein HD556DRAFT_1439779 [Suillus plorans]KAG1799400.1 hypothetical protein HD556DRAFT_1439779 [Suillus plorans]